jgi:hypothetical protein
MNPEDELNARLGALLRSDRGPEEQPFVSQLTQRLMAEERLARARRAAWLRFATEASASAAILCAFVLLGRLGPVGAGAAFQALSPATAAILLLGLWFAVELRPAAGR